MLLSSLQLLTPLVLLFIVTTSTISIKNAVLKNLAILIGKQLCWSLFLINLEVYKPATLLQRDSDASVFLWILRNFYKGLFQRTSVNDCFWTLLIQSGRYINRKNRDVFRDDNQRRFQNPMKHLRWSFLQK